MPCRDYESDGPSWGELTAARERGDQLAAKLCATRHALRVAMQALREADGDEPIKRVIDTLSERNYPLHQLEKDFAIHYVHDLEADKKALKERYDDNLSRQAQISRLGGIVPDKMRAEIGQLERDILNKAAEISRCKDKKFEF